MNLEIDYRAAKVCSLAHGTAQGYEDAGYRNVKMFYGPKTDTEMFVMEDAKYIYLVGRGTEVGEETSWKDIKTDLKFTRRGKAGPYRVHKGFDEAWDEVKLPVMNDVAWRLHHGKQFIVTGHSLGGALAVLAAHSMACDVDHLITFGQPRVGGIALMDELEWTLGTYHRWVHLGDVVCRVPFAFGYAHSGRMMYLSHDGLVVEPSFGRVLGDNWNRWARRFTDHNMKNYLIGIEQAYLGVNQ